MQFYQLCSSSRLVCLRVQPLSIDLQRRSLLGCGYGAGDGAGERLPEERKVL